MLMKKIVLLLMLLSTAAVGIYFANAYSNAIVENPIDLCINNTHGFLSLIPVEGLAVEQGQSAAALEITNNMGVVLHNCRLEHIQTCFILAPGSGFELAPGETREIAIEVSEDCPAGSYSLEVSLCVDFDGGRAKVKSTLFFEVMEVVKTAGPCNCEDLLKPDSENFDDDGDAAETEDGEDEAVDKSGTENMDSGGIPGCEINQRMENDTAAGMPSKE